MTSRKLFFTLCLSSAFAFTMLNAGETKKGGTAQMPSRLQQTVRELPDSIFKPGENEDLLNDEVYLKLAADGWSREEITTIMATAIANKKEAKKKIGYGAYAKEWLPRYGRQLSEDSFYMFVDTLFNEKMRRSVARNVPADLLNAYYPEIVYSPDDRKNGIRRPGYFRPVKFDPSCGRIHWIVLHPEDPDRLYVTPDGAGIFKTDDCGKHWECITDRIPDRANRAQVNGYNIPVDPDDWNHVFAFMNNATVYETTDGGDSWRQIVGATHMSFKRGDCFRDADGNLKFIGCKNTNWNGQLWISEDTCKTWTQVQVPDSLKDINPQTGVKGLWFQYIVQDPTDRNKIYLPTSRSILYFDDGAKSTLVNGQRTYNIKKLHFEVYDRLHQQRRYANLPVDKGADPTNDAIFPCPAHCVGDMVINPNKPTQWWFATGTNLVNGGANSTALYRSEDAGKTWYTVQDVAFGIGSGNMFGNELPGSWLGGFGVNFADTTKVYGCSMSSAKSSNGGRDFTGFGWGTVLRYQMPDGRFVAVAASRHNADNHCIRSHKSGRVFRGSDGGMMMIDPNVNGGEWTQIGSDMNQMLFYRMQTNEFGDQVIAGNTQDIDGQTYRYGRWGKWRGYEGSEVFINPYTSTVYVSNMGMQGLDGENISIGSWQNGQTFADVVTGSWYLVRKGSSVGERTLLRCDDYGHMLTNLQPMIGEPIDLNGKFGLCRDKGRTTIYVVGNSHEFKRSIDNGNTFENLKFNGVNTKFSNTLIATDPNNSDILYLGQKGKVFIYYINESRFEQLGDGLPDVPCSQLFFHEGSGDLYFYHSASAGFYILEYNKTTKQYAPSWRYWTKGYNSGKAGNAMINYTTQEMVICDYGRGVWCADLEHPSDRFFDDGFNLRELSYKDGRRTIGIDTEWTIPLYYHYKWTVNDEVIDNPYQYLRRRLNDGDRVQLELSLRESPDVKTRSAVFIVPTTGTKGDENEGIGETLGSSGSVTYDNPVAKTPGQAIYSNGRGRVDLGYQDYFFNDFTIDFWIKPMTNGTILANRTRQGDNKGFELMINNGALRLEYSPRNVFVLPYNETIDGAVDQTWGLNSTANVKFGMWQHVALTHERNGKITLWLDGQNVGSANRFLPEATLNNSVGLSLFGDAIEQNTIEASVDELKIWTKALSQDEVRREMYSTNQDNKEGLAAYYNFNGGSLENDIEVFSRKPIRSRIKAEVTYSPMTVPTCAKDVIYEQIDNATHTFTLNDRPVIAFSAPEDAAANADVSGQYGIYVFDADQWKNGDDNLDDDYYDYYPNGYLIETFDGISDVEGFQMEFYPVNGDFDSDKNYRVYISDPQADKQIWTPIGSTIYNAEHKSMVATNIKPSDIAGMKVLIATVKPSIELNVQGMNPDGTLPIYDETMTTFPLTATILSGLDEPSEFYNIQEDGIVNPSGFYFTDGKARGELRLDLSKLGSFNTATRATLRSNSKPITDELGNERSSLIPLVIDVVNRITPREKGSAVKLVSSRLDIGSNADFEPITGTRNLSMMAWVRIDDESMLQQNGFNVMVLYRDGGVTGLRLTNGRLEFAYDGVVKRTSTDLKLTQSDLGKWHHLAAVVHNDTLDLYMDGQKETARYSMGAHTAMTGLHFGKNSPLGSTNSTDNLSATIDQAAVWNRPLSHDEVIKYMYTAVPLNDPDLLSYLNMDYVDENSTPRDCFSLAEVKGVSQSGGSVTYGEESSFPFDARAIATPADAESPVTLQFPAGKSRPVSIATFRGTPYCYVNHDFQSYTPLNQEFYGITYRQTATAAMQPAEGDMVTLTFRHRSIVAGDNIAAALRTIGTLEHLAGFIPASSVENGVATFEIPMTYLAKGQEVMFFNYPETSDDPTVTERPAMLQLSFGAALNAELDRTGEVPSLILDEGVNSIPVVADVISLARNYDKPVSIVVNEPYATPSQQYIDFSKIENRFNINLDRSKIDKFGINSLTINLQGAIADELKLNFHLEPKVKLTLLNGDNHETTAPGRDTIMNNSFRSVLPVANLEVSAELTEGYLPEGEKVQLEVLTGMPHAMIIGNGTLLQNDDVTIDGLEFHESSSGALHEGWNMIGNPYLANINLTKERNVDYDPEHITKFIYQCDPVSGNYRVYDMTLYDATHRIKPFEAYFVQTMREDAALTVTTIAKESEPVKRTFAYNAAQRNGLTLLLKQGDNIVDEVTLSYDRNADENYAVNEDAPKMWNLTGSSPELYVSTPNGQTNAINVSPATKIHVGVNAPADAELTLEVKSALSMKLADIKITDEESGNAWLPEQDGTTHSFHTSGQQPNRFLVDLGDDITTALGGPDAPQYRVYVSEQNTVTVTGLQGDASVTVYTPSGLGIVHATTPEPILTIDNLADGIYIVVIRENGREYITKIRV